MNITILGGGSWGSALAIHFAKKKHSIKIWEFFPEQAQHMQEKRECPLLPGVKLSDKIFVSSDMKTTLTNADVIFIVVPSDKVEAAMEKAAPFLKKEPVIICSKGFASKMRLLSDVVKEHSSGPVYCLYGPTHAEEVSRGVFSGLVLAGGEGKEKLKKVIESSLLRVDMSEDLIGVQVAAGLKNVLAIFIGILSGAGFGDNTAAYVLTRGLQEIKTLGLKWGGKTDTFYGLAGIGDIIVTCESKHSRNRHIGEQVGKGRKLADVLAEMKMVAEGVTTVKMVPSLQEKFHLPLPVMMSVYAIMFEGLSVQKALERI